MNQLPPIVERYLQKHSCTLKWRESVKSQAKFKYVIVVPVLAELEHVSTLLESLAENKVPSPREYLILLVINNTVSANPNIKRENSKTHEYLVERKKNFPFPLEVIDAFSEGRELPAKTGGVGLARKIGLDAALRLLDYNYHSGLVCLDADCHVSDNYLGTISKVFQDGNFRAGYFYFEHLLPKDEKEKAAIVCYEIFLRHYVLGLKFANSPYAFHTIGSTMLFDYATYINVGGMNKRKAGEDFYFLEKVAKSFPVREIRDAKVFPSSRPSWRVPFGTGQRVGRFLSQEQDEYVVYSPNSFQVLKEWNRIFLNGKREAAEFYLEAAKKIFPALENFLRENSFEEKWESILKNSKNEKQLLRQKFFWFDGFRTLKLIHYLRDEAFPNVNMFEGVNEMLSLVGQNKISVEEEIPFLSKQLEFLKILRKLA